MATGVIRIDYRSSDICSQANKLAAKYDGARERLHGVDRKLSSMPEHSRNNYLSQSSAFLRKKTQQYDQKRAQTQTLHRRVGDFMDRARDTDRRVATHIEDNYQQFKKITGLKSGGVLGAIGDFIDGLKDNKWLLAFLFGGSIAVSILAIVEVGKAIKAWYDNLPDEAKYWIKAVVAFVGVVIAISLAIVSFGAIAGVWTLIVFVASIVKVVDSIVGLIKAGSALHAFRRGDDALAKQLDKSRNGEFFGATIEALTGIEMERVSFVYDIVNSLAVIVTLADTFVDIGQLMKQEKIGFANALGKQFGKEFFNKEAASKGLEQIKSMYGAWKAGTISTQTLLRIDITDAIKGWKAIHDFGKDFILPVFQDPMPNTASEWAGDIADKVPIVSDFKKIIDKLPKMKPNSILRPEAI